MKFRGSVCAVADIGGEIEVSVQVAQEANAIAGWQIVTFTVRDDANARNAYRIGRAVEIAMVPR